MNIALWVAQGILCAVFLGAGAMKVFAFEKYRESVEKRSPTHRLGLSKGLVSFIGISEVAGAIGLVLPLATGVFPILTAIAAVGLAIVMLLAVGFHVRRHEPMYVPLVLLILAGFVVAGRGLF